MPWPYDTVMLVSRPQLDGHSVEARSLSSIEGRRSNSSLRKIACIGPVPISSAIRAVAMLELCTSVSGTFSQRFIGRSEEHTSELQSLMRISYAVFGLKKKNYHIT